MVWGIVWPSIREKEKKGRESNVVIPGKRANAAGSILFCYAVVKMSVDWYASRRGVSFVRPLKEERKNEKGVEYGHVEKACQGG